MTPIATMRRCWNLKRRALEGAPSLGVAEEVGTDNLRHRLSVRALRTYALVVLGLSIAGCSEKRITADPVYFPSPPNPPHAVHVISFNSLHEIVQPTSHWLDYFRGGPVSPFVRRPAGIAYHNDRLYVCDTGANMVHVWNLETGQARRLGDRDPLVLGEPVDVAVGGDGAVFVADTQRGEVVEFGRGEPRRLAPADRSAYRPVALEVKGNQLLVADITSHRVDVLDASTGNRTSAFGSTGSGFGQFYFPMGLAIDAANRLYVADAMNSRVQVFDPAHAFALAIGGPGDRYGCLGKPRHVAVGPDGVVFIADPEFQYVHLFTSQGELLMLLGGPDEPVAATPMPVGVAVAKTLPAPIAALVPAGFKAAYYLFITNATGEKRISLYAMGN